jgi:hypothetical protein
MTRTIEELARAIGELREMLDYVDEFSVEWFRIASEITALERDLIPLLQWEAKIIHRSIRRYRY